MVLYNYMDECIAIRSVGHIFIPIKDMISKLLDWIYYKSQFMPRVLLSENIRIL